MKLHRSIKAVTLFLFTILLLSACSSQKDGQAENEVGKSVTNVAAPWIATKNTTRINSSNPVESAVLVSKTLWPATANDNRPGAVILASTERWGAALASLDLVHHPNNGPLLYMDKNGIPQATLDEIKRLKPIGIGQAKEQVIVIGGSSNKVKEQLNKAGFKASFVAGKDDAEIAEQIDTLYTKASGSQPDGVIVGSLDSPEYTIPAGNWIAHMLEPLLFVTKKEIPKATIRALEKRKGRANIYVIGPESVVSADLENKLKQYGTVKRIAGKNPIENSIAFAKYKDETTGFGWGITTPGHNLSFVPADNHLLAISAAPFSHLGKHAPLIWTEKEKMPNSVMDYVMTLQPKYKVTPTEGPFNHAWIVGNEKDLTPEAQGEIDSMLEIVSASGKGHGDHGSTAEDDTSSNENETPSNNGHGGGHH
ncbi:cell wall-binding repeat-containing protein [Paenibacillus sp. SC116]|uniref:cell wall-binding repeat-containing protein n=1 Tax=Paenibacillus sp. SC116 TaxID=2968986 RepID=UPI00215A7588|nr:cell wall-binding repeat-containing protein [Paenibacillus sp. SC116]MCR8845569.1 cell wall-binding repeat-containing protein [Paenibacillus sp. SC116]